MDNDETDAMNQWGYFFAFCQMPICWVAGYILLFKKIGLTDFHVFVIPASMLIFAIAYLLLIYRLWDAVQSQFTRITPWSAILSLFNPASYFDALAEWCKVYNKLARRADPPLPEFPNPFRRGNILTIILLIIIPPLGFIDIAIRAILFIIPAIAAVHRLNAANINRYYNVNLYSAQMEEDGWDKKLSVAEYYKQRRKEKAKLTAEQTAEPECDEWGPLPDKSHNEIN